MLAFTPSQLQAFVAGPFPGCCRGQRPSIKGVTDSALPEKLGELIASLHFILVSKMLRKITKGKTIHRTFTVKGLLLDKVCGTMQCSLSIQMKG